MRRARGTPGEEVWRRKKSATMVAHAADAGHGCGRCPGALGCVRWLLASHGAKHSHPESSELPPPRNRNSQNESSFSAVFRPQRQNHGSFRNVCVVQNSLASSWCPGFLRRARGTPGEEVWERKKSATMVAHAVGARRGCGRCPGALGCVWWFLASHGAKHSPRSPRSFPRHGTAIPEMRRHFRRFSGHNARTTEVLEMFVFSKIRWHRPGALGSCGAFGGLLARRSGSAKSRPPWLPAAAGGVLEHWGASDGL